jgi:ubiquinol-cytochrome c reductase core subunit 2
MWQTRNARQQINIVGLERAHQLAFRTGLGNPLFSELKDFVDHHTVRKFARTIFTRSNIVVVGSGVDHKALLGYVHLHFDLKDPEQTKSQSTYYGGDDRTMGVNQNAHCTIAFQGFPVCSNEYYASKVLQEILGSQNHLKWGTDQCKLTTVKSQISTDSEITTFNIGYSDNGLFGVQINTPNHDIGKAVKLTMDVMATLSCKIADHEISRAKNHAKLNVASIAQSRLDSMDYLGFRVSEITVTLLMSNNFLKGSSIRS